MSRNPDAVIHPEFGVFIAKYSKERERLRQEALARDAMEESSYDAAAWDRIQKQKDADK